MSDNQAAAIEAAIEAIEDRPHREYPNMVNTSAWGPPMAGDLGVYVEFNNVGIRPGPTPINLPPGWKTIEQAKAGLVDQTSDIPVNPA